MRNPSLPQTPALIPFQKILDAFLDIDKPLDPRYPYRLSDLEKNDAKRLSEIWPTIALWRRQALMEDIAELSSKDTLLDFVTICRIALADEDPPVRLLAIQILWEFEDTSLIPAFIQMMENDPDEAVRAAATTALGRYVYLGEIEELPQATLRHIEDSLLHVCTGNDAVKVRRFALESLGFSSRDEVPSLIEKAYTSNIKDWVVSALMAMGRSGGKEWKSYILAMLESKLPQYRSEAARAAGELELTQARPILLELLDDPDDNTRANSIWSLSQIGGQGVREALEALYEETDDEDELSLLDEALDNLEFNEGLALMPLLDLADTDEQEVEDDDFYSSENFEPFEDEDNEEYEEDYEDSDEDQEY